MYLHIGQNVVVPSSSIVGIFDMDTVTLSKHTRAFLSALEKAGRLIPLFDDLPKACVHCVENGESIVYISQLSTATLLRRSGLTLGE
ncbi:MAG: DUF370 domain-containing protein [Eubacteriales bacterium]|nr:DUF370 domain-containing protein [Eubacteriales bacterium]